MGTLEYIIGGLLLALAVATVWLVGAQQSKRKSGLSGSIAGNGASESYLSRNKIASKESSFKKITLVVAIFFIIFVLALYIIGSVDEKDETSDTIVNENIGAVSSEAATESSVASSEAATESSAVESSEAATESSVVESSEAATESSVVESSEAPAESSVVAE